MLASARAAHTMRTADRFGLVAVEPEIDTARVFERIRAVQACIEVSDDNPERFTDLGVDVFLGAARLTGPGTLEVEGAGPFDARYVLVCTGSRPAIPSIPGLSEGGHLTTETVWSLDRAPESLALIGGGPVCVELAQAFRRLGTATTLLTRGPRILPRDEPALAERLTGLLRAEGVEVVTGVEVSSVEREGARKTVRGIAGGSAREWRAEQVLVSTGRVPNIDGLGLEAAGVETGPDGVVVNDRMRSSAKWLYAAGDVAGRHRFTHSAGYEAAAAVRNMFFPGSSAAPALVPWCTFTDPELAHAGLTEEQAVECHGKDRVRVWTHDLSHSDRARTDAATEGEIRIVTAKGRIVGAHALAEGAGEVIHELALAIHEGRRLADLGELVHVYPTLSLGTGLLAGQAGYEKAERLGFLVRSKA